MHVFSKDMMQLESQDKLGWKGLLEFSLWSKQGQLFMNLCSWGLNSSKDGDLKASLSNVFQYLTTLSVKFFLFYPVRIALVEPWLLLLSFHSTLLKQVWLYYFFKHVLFKANKIQKLRPGNTGFSIKFHPSLSNQNCAGEIDLINSLQPTKTSCLRASDLKCMRVCVNSLAQHFSIFGKEEKKGTTHNCPLPPPVSNLHPTGIELLTQALINKRLSFQSECFL